MTEQGIYKSNLILILVFTVCLLIVYSMFIYIIDPLEQFRAAKIYHPIYVDEMYQNAGMAKHYQYDTVIIGSSTAENFKPSFIQKTLGFHTLKLTLHGTTASEEKVILETAIATGKVKNVLFGLDDFTFEHDLPIREGFPLYLYSFHKGDKLKYLFNIGNIGIIFKIFLENVIYNSKTNLDDAYSWNATAKFSEKNVINAWQLTKKHLVLEKNTSFATMRSSFDKNLLNVIIKNPHINFYLFYPPYSTLEYKKMQIMGIFSDFLQFKKYIFEATKNLPNVRLYDFQSEKQIANNFNNYKDMIHYSEAINNYIITHIKTNKYLVTSSNVDPMINQLYELAQIPL